MLRLLLFAVLLACSGKDTAPPDTGDTDSDTGDTDTDTDTDSDTDSDTDTDTDSDTDTDTSSSNFPSIVGDCDVLDSELADSTPHAFSATIDFSETGFNEAYLSAGGSQILNTENAGGSSIYSEVFAYELLFHCENAQLLKTETEITYQNPQGKITDILVEIDTLKIGVSVTRAYVYPPDTPYTAELAEALLTKKLNGIQESSANVAETDAWEKQILYVMAYTSEHTDQVLNVFDTLDPTLKADTILMVATTDGDDEFMY